MNSADLHAKAREAALQVEEGGFSGLSAKRGLLRSALDAGMEESDARLVLDNSIPGPNDYEPAEGSGAVFEGSGMVVVLTLEVFPGRIVTEVLSLVRGTAIVVGHLGSGFATTLTSIGGGDLKGWVERTNRAQQDALDRMRAAAGELGAHAVLGVRLMSSDVLAGAVEVTAYGTAVRLAPTDPPQGERN
jgi:uncharacterized protein YbjQ (UPF0145 family)